MSFERIITHDGLTLTLSEWSRKTGLKINCILGRIDSMGWPVDKALNTPSRHWTWKKPKEFKKDKERREEIAQIREWLRTQPSHVDERRDEGDIL